MIYNLQVTIPKSHKSFVKKEAKELISRRYLFQKKQEVCHMRN